MYWCTCGCDRYDRHADIVVRGFSGYNSRWALDVLRTKLLASSSPDLYSMATIFFGANDAVLYGEPQHCPLEEFQSNITYMVEAFREHNPEIQLLLITPGTVDHTLWSTRHPDQVALYAAAVRTVGAALRVPVVDLWQGSHAFSAPHSSIDKYSSGSNDGEQSEGGKEEDFSDGLHLSPSGNAKVFAGVMQVIQEHYADSLPDPEQLHFPSWKDLAGKPAAETLEIVQKWKWNK